MGKKKIPELLQSTNFITKLKNEKFDKNGKLQKQIKIEIKKGD
jgi:hypothetical protein